MKIMQSGIPTSDLLKKGLDVETCLKFQLGNILINDGAGGGKKQINDLLDDRITVDHGLILFAKDADTMMRGLAKINQDHVIKGDGGLCVVAMRHSGSAPMSGAKKVGQFLQWSAERGKQGFIHDSYDIAKFFASIAKATILKNNSNRHKVHDKVDAMYANFGMKSKVTFATFKSIVDPKLKRKCTMLMICLNRCVPLDYPEGVSVIRNINRHMSATELQSNARRVFAGKSNNPFNGTAAIHEFDEWNQI